VKTPPGLLGRLVICDYGGSKLHIVSPTSLDWHHERVKTFCGRGWPLPERTRRWEEVDEDEICKTCLHRSQVWESVKAENPRHFWSR
jgi:hypothetical protein